MQSPRASCECVHGHTCVCASAVCLYTYVLGSFVSQTIESAPPTKVQAEG